MEEVEKMRNSRRERPNPMRAAESISRSLSRASWNMEEVFSGSHRHSRRSSRVDEDEEALKWAAIEKLPTYDRLRTSIMQSHIESEMNGPDKVVHTEVDVTKLDINERQKFIDKLFKVAEEDNEKFLQKFRNRIEKVGIGLPTVEVRFDHLTIEADCYIGNRALPSLLNTARNIFESILDLLSELARREKDAGIFPEAEVDLFMKATAMKGVESSLITDYTLKILGLDICKDTIVGDDMQRGISGGQKKRVTTGEMIVGPTKTLFMDEISTGLDSSTTFQIVKCLQQIVHLTEASILMSLLQPAPETFDLFDDIILLSEGQIVYEGPREHILQFFETCGFRCPERKGTADFLQEVTSKKDQEQYWADKNKQYRYIPVPEFAARFKRFHVGMHLENELSVPYDKSRAHRAALVFKRFCVPKMDLLKACWDKEWMLIKRNSFVYVFKTVQIIIVAIIASTVFIRTKMHTRNEGDAGVYVGALLFSMIINMFNGFSELSMIIARLPVFYKQRDLMFHPVWTFTLPTFLLKVPISIFESIVWMAFTYYTIGFAPEASRFFKQLLLVFLIQQMASGLFRLIAGVCRTMIIANTGGALTLLLVFLLGGFILPKGDIPKWWQWGYWISPLSYGYNAFTVNEMFAPRWMNKNGTGLNNGTKLGVAVLKSVDIPAESYWYWIGAAALFGFIVLFNVLFTIALMYLNPLGKPQAIISEETAAEIEGDQDELSKEEPRLRRPQSKKDATSRSLSASDGNNSREMAMQRMGSRSNPNGLSRNGDASLEAVNGVAPKRGMVLPFTPLAMSFDSVNYYVDMPAVNPEGVFSGGLRLDSEDEKGQTLTAMEKLPTYNRLRTGLLQYPFIERNFKVAEQDNHKFLTKFRDRIDKALPTLIKCKKIAESALSFCGFILAQRTKLTILKNVSGIIKPSRMTLLLAPPSSGKTTLLLALAGKLDPSLKVGGPVTYNDYRLDEFVPQKTSAYVSQNDVHFGDLTVKETLDYSARFQGVGFRYDLVKELSKREKGAGIHPEADVDLFMKATAVEGAESSLITDYTLKRGISGGQKKRVTTGEMIVGPTKTLFMDEISTGLDSSTT
ncbi:hypothetical protein EZV62_028185 [Acer yangbiense]|uniref:ABC transporter domain-containing protein n=1 Tax=Acer yangbiense TaxID=1000413 RepID=A0A5C7GP57_9ROSI|nr:hypothetical protein EZV62_028185 [Acer yangbiense]